LHVLARAHGTFERVVAGTPYIIAFDLRQSSVAIVAVAHDAQGP
jgi:plasmid stabilization system protein ParE